MHGVGWSAGHPFQGSVHHSVPDASAGSCWCLIRWDCSPHPLHRALDPCPLSRDKPDAEMGLWTLWVWLGTALGFHPFLGQIRVVHSPLWLLSSRQRNLNLLGPGVGQPQGSLLSLSFAKFPWTSHFSVQSFTHSTPMEF